MVDDRDRLTKVLALAMHPQTIPEEAFAAFRRARELVKANPALADQPALRLRPVPKPSRGPQTNFTCTITNIHPEWVFIIVDHLSRRAYELDLRCQITFDFTKLVTGINIRATGAEEDCDQLEDWVNWTVDYVNNQLKHQHRHT